MVTVGQSSNLGHEASTPSCRFGKVTSHEGDKLSLMNGPARAGWPPERVDEYSKERRMEKRQRLYIHIGMHKTGTKTIQAAFATAGSGLAESGLHYLRTGFLQDAVTGDWGPLQRLRNLSRAGDSPLFWLDGILLSHLRHFLAGNGCHRGAQWTV